MNIAALAAANRELVEVRRERDEAVALLREYRERGYANINALHDSIDLFLSRIEGGAR